MHIFFSVGEPSGDQHAAHLIRELKRRRPDVECSGFGGPLMQEAGCRLDFPLTLLAVMGLFQVVPLLWQFFKLIRLTGRLLKERRPDAVVLVDFPGFNWWVARKAKAAGVPVYYYLPPQLWAWAPWRIRKVRKSVDHVLSGLTFETEWYAQRGIPVTYVGHPFFDEVAERRLDQSFCREWSSEQTPTVALLPGSRQQEVTQNWPLMLQVVRRLTRRHPEVTFLVACYRESQRIWCAQQLAALGENLPVVLFVGKTPEIIELADCALMVSGSVSLEMLARVTPAVVLYRCGWLTYLIGRMLVTCQFMSLPNLMAGRAIMPEFLCVTNPLPVIHSVTRILDHWLSDRAAMIRAATELHRLREDIYETGATARAAEVILHHAEPVPAARAA